MTESENEKKDQAEGSEKPVPPPGWEDSPTAASLPIWWPAAPPEPAHPHAAPAPAPPPAAPPPATKPEAMPTTPGSPAAWDASTTAGHLPSWWRPEQPPASAEPLTAPAVPPMPNPNAPPMPAPTAPPMPASTAPPAPTAIPAQSLPAAHVPPPAVTPMPPLMAPPTSSPPPAAASEKPATIVLGESGKAAVMKPPQPRTDLTMVLGVVPAAVLPMAILTVKAGPDVGFKFRIKPLAKAYIGRDTDNDVVLDDPGTSRSHAQIEFRDGTYVVTDLGSVNGTLVNGERVVERALVNGDRITVGQDELVISIM